VVPWRSTSSPRPLEVSWERAWTRSSWSSFLWRSTRTLTAQWVGEIALFKLLFRMARVYELHASRELDPILNEARALWVR
jgi:hypothetical protein